MCVAASAGEPQLLWKFSLQEETGYFAAKADPAVAPDGTVYVATFVGQLLALTPEGKVRWKFQAGREIHTALAIGEDGTVYFGCRDHRFYAVSPEGKLRWTFGTGDWVDSSPALAADGTIYFGSWDGNFYALDPGGKLKWQFATGGIISSSPAIGTDGTIYFGGHDGWFYALKPDGSLRWRYQVGGVIASSPALGADGRVIFTAMNHYLYVLSADGHLLWSRDIKNITASSPVLDRAGNIFLTPGKLDEVITPDGQSERVVCALPTVEDISALAAPDGSVFFTQTWRCLDQFALAPGCSWAQIRYAQIPHWQAPTAGNLLASLVLSPEGRIYVLDEGYLYAFASDWGPQPWRLSSWPMFRANARHTGRIGP